MLTSLIHFLNASTLPTLPGPNFLQLHRKIKPLAFWALMSLGFMLVSCYTFTGTTLPGYLKTIYIHPVDNQSLNPQLAENVFKALQTGFQQRSNLRLVHQDAHSEIKLVLQPAQRSPYNISGSDVTSYQIRLTAEVLFYDRVKSDTLYYEKALSGYGVYIIDKNETEIVGQQRATDELLKLILDKTIARW